MHKSSDHTIQKISPVLKFSWANQYSTNSHATLFTLVFYRIWVVQLNPSTDGCFNKYLVHTYIFGVGILQANLNVYIIITLETTNSAYAVSFIYNLHTCTIHGISVAVKNREAKKKH